MRKKKSGDRRASENVARSPEGNGRGMMQARKIAIERERRSRQEERVCLRRGENPRGERNLASLPPSLLPFFSPVIPRERENRREKERTEEASERVSEHTSGGWLLLLRPRHYLRTINSQNFPLESCSRLGSSPLYPP